jgi:hypothetical protein
LYASLWLQALALEADPAEQELETEQSEFQAEPPKFEPYYPQSEPKVRVTGRQQAQYPSFHVDKQVVEQKPNFEVQTFGRRFAPYGMTAQKWIGSNSQAVEVAEASDPWLL